MYNLSSYISPPTVKCAMNSHSLSPLYSCSSDVAMFSAWVVLELLLLPAPCAGCVEKQV